jgi:hypothetical protein
MSSDAPEVILGTNIPYTSPIYGSSTPYAQNLLNKINSFWNNQHDNYQIFTGLIHELTLHIVNNSIDNDDKYQEFYNMINDSFNAQKKLRDDLIDNLISKLTPDDIENIKEIYKNRPGKELLLSHIVTKQIFETPDST